MDALTAEVTPPKRGESEKQRWHWHPLTAAAVLVAAVAICAVVVLSGPLRHQIVLSVRRQPTPYASLFFTSPGSLPSDLPVRADYPVTFTVANHDGRDRSFQFRVTLASRSHDDETTTGLVTVAGNGDTRETVNVRPLEPCDPCKVTVALPTEHALIYFTAGSSA